MDASLCAIFPIRLTMVHFGVFGRRFCLYPHYAQRFHHFLAEKRERVFRLPPAGGEGAEIRAGAPESRGMR